MLAWRVRHMWKSMAEKIQTLHRYFIVEEVQSCHKAGVRKLSQ